jgi:uncharacterized membrane protein YesL
LAGFFGLFDFTKPGKGVDKDAPRLHPFFLFWALYWRKFSRLVLINFIYFVLLLPIIFIIYLTFNELLGFFELLPEISADTESGVVGIPGMLVIAILSGIYGSPVFLVLLLASAILYGPATCGFTYILRNYSREEHAWLSDFWSRAKSNFRQGLAIGLLEIAAFYVFVMNITLSGAGSPGGVMDWLLLVSRVLSVALFVIFLFMRHYLYLMVVTFDLKVSHIIKNAFFFAFIGLPKNVLCVVVELLICLALLATAGLFGGIIELVLSAFFLLSLGGFACVSLCYPVIRKYMLKDEPPDGSPPDEPPGEAPPEGVSA